MSLTRIPTAALQTKRLFSTKLSNDGTANLDPQRQENLRCMSRGLVSRRPRAHTTTFSHGPPMRNAEVRPQATSVEISRPTPIAGRFAFPTALLPCSIRAPGAMKRKQRGDAQLTTGRTQLRLRTISLDSVSEILSAIWPDGGIKSWEFKRWVPKETEELSSLIIQTKINSPFSIGRLAR